MPSATARRVGPDDPQPGDVVVGPGAGCRVAVVVARPTERSGGVGVRSGDGRPRRDRRAGADADGRRQVPAAGRAGLLDGSRDDLGRRTVGWHRGARRRWRRCIGRGERRRTLQVRHRRRRQWRWRELARRLRQQRSRQQWRWRDLGWRRRVGFGRWCADSCIVTCGVEVISGVGSVDRLAARCVAARWRRGAAWRPSIAGDGGRGGCGSRAVGAGAHECTTSSSRRRNGSICSATSPVPSWPGLRWRPARSVVGDGRPAGAVTARRATGRVVDVRSDQAAPVPGAGPRGAVMASAWRTGLVGAGAGAGGVAVVRA